MIGNRDGISATSGDVVVMKVIRTRLQTRGEGTSDDPIRTIEQFWTMDGYLLCEIDPHWNAQRGLK